MDFLRSGLSPSLRKSTVFYHKVTAILILFQLAIAICVNYILNNYSKEIDLQALAQSIGYSYHHFRHVFKEVYSFSPKQFIIKTRMNAAKNLLSTTDYKVETISELCGYRSVSQFIDTFSREVSVTPLKFRKEWGKYPESANFLK